MIQRRGGARIHFADVRPVLRGQPSCFGAAMVPVRGPVLGHLISQLEDPSATSRPYWVAFVDAGNKQVKTLVLWSQTVAVLHANSIAAGSRDFLSEPILHET